MRRPLNVAIVGAGLMGRWHAHAASRAGAPVVAVIDPNAEGASRLTKRCPGARAYPALETALEQCRIDVVHVCTPTRSHFPLASVALARGKHVLIEKPMTASAEETESLVAMARAGRLLIAPVHQFPFQRGFRQLRLDQARLGDAARVTFLCCTAGAAGLGAMDRRTALLEVLPHPLSLFHALFGDEVFDRLEVFAPMVEGGVEVGGVLRGARLNAAVSLDARPTQLGLAYLGTRSSGYVDLFHGSYFREDGHVSRRAKLTRPFVHGAKTLGASGRNLIRRTIEAEWAYPGLLELTRQFYRSIQSGAPPPIDEKEAIGTARALDRFRQAIERADDGTPAR